MGILRLQTASGTKVAATGSPHTLAVGQITAGSLLICAVGVDGITDKFTSLGDGTNTFTRIGTPQRVDGGGGNGWFYFAYKENATAVAAPTLSLALSGISASVIIFMEFSGFSTSVLDANIYAGGSASTALNSTAAATTAQAYELLVNGGYSDLGGGTYTLGEEWQGKVQAQNADNDGYMAYQIVNITGAYTAKTTLSSASDNSCGIATFKASGTSAVSRNDKTLRPHPFSPGLAR